MRSSKLPLDTKIRSLKLQSDCFFVGDYVRIYDGNSTTSPVLITFCNGAELPDITSSGSSLLIEFTTSPYDSPTHESPWKYISGFELIAQSKFVEKSQNAASPCFSVLTAQHGFRGWITSPPNSITPNTSCTWDIQGPPGHIVWIIFARYSRDTQVVHHLTTLCESKLTIVDWGLNGTDRNETSHCRDTLPKTCDRIGRLQHENTSVPFCGMDESYITRGDKASITQDYGKGSLITNVNFFAYYEFVDLRQEGEERDSVCYRWIKSEGKVGSKRLRLVTEWF